jgi:DNA replication protein DnaC
VGDAPAVSTKGKEVRIERPTLQGTAEKHNFAYDFTFGAKSRQFDVFRDLGWPCVKNAWSGYNVSIFAYGQTGSGKSHSMMGTEKNPGLIR